MARKKSYIKLAEETLVHGENWKDVYLELRNVPEGNIEQRIARINEELVRMQSELVNRQTVVRSGMDAKQRNSEANETIIAEMLDISTQLQGEKNILERLSRVKRNMNIIATARQTIYQRMKQEKEAYTAAKERLEKAEAKMKAFEEAESDLDSEISEAQEAVNSAKGKTVKAAMTKVLEELKEKKGKIGSRDKIEKELQAAKADVEKYGKGLSELRASFDKTGNPWEKIFAGMGWKDIANLTEQKINQIMGIPKKKKEEKLEERPDSGEQGENAGTGSRAGNNGTGIGGIPPKPDHQELELPEEEPDLPQEEPEEDTEKTWAESHKILGKIPFLANMMDKKVAKQKEQRERMESFKRAFTEKNNGEPGFLDRLCVRFPRLSKWLGRDFEDLIWDNKGFEEELAATVTESSSERPKEVSAEEREKIIQEAQKLLRRNTPKAEVLRRIEDELSKLSPEERAERKRIAQEIVEQGVVSEEAEKAYQELKKARRAMEKRLEERRMIISQDMKSLKVEQLEAGLHIWIAEGLFTYNDVLSVAVRAAQKEGKTLEEGKLAAKVPQLSQNDVEEMRGRIDKQLNCLTPEEVTSRRSSWIALNIYSLDEIKSIYEKSEKQAKEIQERKERMLGKKEVSASRQRHRDFGAQINQDAQVVAKAEGDNIPKVEAELVSRSSYEAGRASVKASSAPSKAGISR